MYFLSNELTSSSYNIGKEAVHIACTDRCRWVGGKVFDIASRNAWETIPKQRFIISASQLNDM